MRGARITGALFLCFAICPPVLETPLAEIPAAAAAPVPAKVTMIALVATQTETGKASWYGEPFHGRITASGSAFNMYALTAAHRTLPLGSLVRVTNLRNHRSAIVLINDRWPVPENVVLDVSYATAEALHFTERGLAPVRIELLAPTANRT